jgi:dephospho-CoA kinase
MKIIAFIGMPAAGKSEAAIIASEMGYPVVNMGDVIREEVKRCGLAPTDANLGRTGTRFRREEGPAAIAKRCIQDIKAVHSDIVIVDGVRNIEEVYMFKEEFGDAFLLINIRSSFDNRLTRIKLRGREDDMLMDKDALRIRDKRELSWGIGDSIKNADMHIENDRTLDEFRQRVQKVIEDYES